MKFKHIVQILIIRNLYYLQSGLKIHTMVQVGGEAVRVCKFSPDSSLLVTAGDNGQVCVWDLIRRTLIRYT
jgi:WD40 repeat protein